ncbi:MAG: glutathione S-transferase family protein [Chromatiales bacterium]|jgi:glutathione S-transferase|nr:glutathione S-transferase family protein [Chromatiales bacterium]
MTVQIYGFLQSNFVRAVCMAAQEKGVDYEVVSAMPHSDEVKAINPLGLIPAMCHGDVAVAESSAIIRYMDTVFDGPSLFPADPVDAARVNQWMGTVMVSVDRLLMRRFVVEYTFHKDADGNVVRDEIDKALKGFPKMFAMLDKAVKGGYLGGDTFSIADCYLTPILFSVQRFPEGKEAVANSAALTKYFETMSARPSFVATAP